MKDTYIFKRVEKKYKLTVDQRRMLFEMISNRLLPDEHGVSTICSLYLDTPDYLLIRNSIDARTYKEKLRVRSYGVPGEQTKVFFEIKKKFKGVVYKRRVSMTCAQAIRYINGGVSPVSGQIMDEIDWAMKFYKYPSPSVALFYEREAFTADGEDGLRLTFDTKVRYRTDDLESPHDSSGKTIIPDDITLMEIKTGGAMPLWLSRALDECRIFPTSFSKYGTAYADICRCSSADPKGEHSYA